MSIPNRNFNRAHLTASDRRSSTGNAFLASPGNYRRHSLLHNGASNRGPRQYYPQTSSINTFYNTDATFHRYSTNGQASQWASGPDTLRVETAWPLEHSRQGPLPTGPYEASETVDSGYSPVSHRSCPEGDYGNARAPPFGYSAHGESHDHSMPASSNRQDHSTPAANNVPNSEASGNSCTSSFYGPSTPNLANLFTPEDAQRAYKSAMRAFANSYADKISLSQLKDICDEAEVQDTEANITKVARQMKDQAYEALGPDEEHWYLDEFQKLRTLGQLVGLDAQESTQWAHVQSYLCAKRAQSLVKLLSADKTHSTEASQRH